MYENNPLLPKSDRDYHTITERLYSSKQLSDINNYRKNISG